jgi:hypothetical protein
LGSPRTRVQMFDNHLVHPLIGGKDLDGGSAQLCMSPLSVSLVSMRSHGFLKACRHAIVRCNELPFSTDLHPYVG